MLTDKKVLVVGVGSTGTEILKLLLNYKIDLTILDYDTVMITDLNRQFYSREIDIGKTKVSVIKEYFEKYFNRNLNILEGNLYDFDLEDYDIVFCCLDNIEARMELNCRMARKKGILIDIGIENMFAHVKKVIFGETSCLYCIKDLYVENNLRNYCSLRGSKKREDEIYLLSQKYEQIETIEEVFNSRNEIKTNEFEIIGIRDDIIGNTCYIASIAASLAIIILNDEKNDFYFYNGSKSPDFICSRMEINLCCFICNSI